MDKFDLLRLGEEFGRLKRELELRAKYSDEQLMELLKTVRAGEGTE
jgi:type II secretory pathway component PulF